MSLYFGSLFSGSSGNATYVGNEDGAVLVDVGVSCKRTLAALEQTGLSVKNIKAVLVTHEHSDHICGVDVLCRKLHVPVYASEKTWTAMENTLAGVPSVLRRTFVSSQDFYIGRLNIQPYKLPHDAADHMGYTIFYKGIKVCIATDLGHVPKHFEDMAERADVLLLEANHDVDMLKNGAYPQFLKKRILGKKGHLSNEDAGAVLSRLVQKQVRQVILGHLSRENNTPKQAYDTVCSVLNQQGIHVGKDIDIHVAPPNIPSKIFAIG